MSKRRSVPSLFERQLVNWSTTNFRSSTVVQYQSVVRCFEQFLKPRKLTVARGNDVIAYVTSCAEHSRGRALAALHGFLGYLVDCGKLKHDPSAGVTIADIGRIGNRDEVQRLLRNDGVSSSELRLMTWGSAIVRMLGDARVRPLSAATRDALLLLFRERFPGREMLRDLGAASTELIF